MNSNNAISNLNDLLDYEREALLSALRRDMKAEEDRAFTDPYWADVHRAQARLDLRLLQLLNPKSRRNEKVIQPLGEIRTLVPAPAPAAAQPTFLPALLSDATISASLPAVAR